MAANKNTNQAEFKTWDQYKEESKREPFQLPVSKDETIVIEAPNGAALIHWSRAFRQGDTEAMLTALCGDQWERVEELLPEGGWEVLPRLTHDISSFFGLQNGKITLIGPNGSKRTVDDPIEAQRLMEEGWEPGESRTRS